MHREAKKNALLAEAENEIMDVGDRNTQDGFFDNFTKDRFINSSANKRWTGVSQNAKIKEPLVTLLTLRISNIWVK